MTMLTRSSAVVSRVVVFDQSPLFRHALADLLRFSPGFELTGETSKVEEVMLLADAGDANFFILDLDAGTPVLDLLEKLKSGRECRCVMTITVGREAELMAAIRTQADGFLSKRHTADEFVRLLGKVARGEMVISDILTNALAMTLRSAPFPDDSRSAETLSPREVEVLQCIATGLSNKQISEQLGISDGTVKVHVKHVLKKLRFATRVEAALWASQNGLTTGR